MPIASVVSPLNVLMAGCKSSSILGQNRRTRTCCHGPPRAALGGCSPELFWWQQQSRFAPSHFGGLSFLVGSVEKNNRWWGRSSLWL